MLPASQWVWEPQRAGRDLQHAASCRGEQSSVGLIPPGWRQRVLHWEPGRGQEARSGLGTRSKHGEDVGSSRQRPSLVSGRCSGHPGDVLPGQHPYLCHPSGTHFSPKGCQALLSTRRQHRERGEPIPAAVSLRVLGTRRGVATGVQHRCAARVCVCIHCPLLRECGQLTRAGLWAPGLSWCRAGAALPTVPGQGHGQLCDGLILPPSIPSCRDNAISQLSPGAIFWPQTPEPWL